MSDPTDYRRKLAEAIERAFCDWHGSDDTRNLLDVFLAALASEGVVDPEAKNALLIEQTLGYIAEIERLEAAVKERGDE